MLLMQRQRSRRGHGAARVCGTKRGATAAHLHQGVRRSWPRWCRGWCRLLRSSATEEAVSELAALTGLSMEGSTILLMAVSGNLNLAKELYFCNEAVQAQDPAALEPAATWSETSPSATQPPLRPLSRVVASLDRPLLLPNDVREHAGEKRRRWQETLWEMEEAAMNSKPLITFDKLVTKMAIMLRNVHGAAKKIKEVDSTALAWQKAKEKAREPRKAPRSQKAKAQRARARAARAPRGPHVQSVGAGGSSLSMALFTASSSCDRREPSSV